MMRSKEHALPVRWLISQAAVMGQAETKRSGNKVNRTRNSKSADVVKEGSRRGVRWASDHFEDVQQLLTQGGDVSMTADKVRHFGRREQVTRRRVWRDSMQIVEAQGREITRLCSSLAACDQDNSLAEDRNRRGGGSAQMRQHRMFGLV